MNPDRNMLLAQGTRMLSVAGIESAADDAAALLQLATERGRLEDAVELFERRATREPLEYILGSCRFCGLELLVDARVLIPTEERTATLVRPAVDAPEGARVHEVGTGSGAVALAVKAARPDLAVTASDISAEAIDVACENARRLDLDVRFEQADGLPEGTYDLVLANLPYTDSAQATQQLPPEQTDFQPGVALWAGSDSLALVKALIQAVPSGTRIALEHGPHHVAEMHRLLSNATTLRDGRGDERVTIGTAPGVQAATPARAGVPR